MRADQIEVVQSVGRPTIHPGGDRAVIAVSHPDLEADATVGQLWEVPVRDGVPRRLTRGVGDSAPRFSPDGHVIAFLRATSGSPPQLCVVDARGGEPIVVTDLAAGVLQFAWSPDSTRLAVIARVPEPGRYGTVDGLRPAAEPARRITTLKYRSNGLGYTNDRRAQLHVLDLPGLDTEPTYPRAPRPADAGGTASADASRGDQTDTHQTRMPEARRLTADDADWGHPVFSADGRRIAVAAARHPGSDTDLRSDVWWVSVDGGVPERATPESPALAVTDVAVAPDDAIFVVAVDLGPHGRDFVGRAAALYRLRDGILTRLTDPNEHDLGEPGAHVEVAADGSVLAASRRRGRVELLRVDLDGRVERAMVGDSVVLGHATAAGSTVVALAGPSSAGELAAIRSGTDAPRMLTDFAAAVRDAGIVDAVEEEHPSRDGYPVHGWVASPAGPGPHPVLLMIHGGPFAQYGVGLFDETQVYVDAGYAVVYANPRGSAGYGTEHARAIKERMGTVDLDDVLAFLDGAVARHPELDGGRVGILGGSYGGYLTAWAIAHDHRFAAAVVERGYLDPEAFIGTSDIGSFFSAEYTGTDSAHRLTQSPQAVVDRVRTPTLVIHSENDLRCPLGQAERYYAALRVAGVHTELVIFPGEDHELSRAGRPRHRVERFEAILDWFSRHLPVSA